MAADRIAAALFATLFIGCAIGFVLLAWTDRRKGPKP